MNEDESYVTKHDKRTRDSEMSEDQKEWAASQDGFTKLSSFSNTFLPIFWLRFKETLPTESEVLQGVGSVLASSKPLVPTGTKPVPSD